MSERLDPSGQGSQPSPIESFSEAFVSHAEQTSGRGVLTSAGEKLAEVTYVATLMESGTAFEKVRGPVFAGHGVVMPVEGADFSPDAPELVLQLDDGRSLPVEFEARVGERGYRFQVVRRR